jgi:hypothetical protein
MAAMLYVIYLLHDEVSSVYPGTGVPVRIRPWKSSSVSDDHHHTDADQAAAF